MDTELFISFVIPVFNEARRIEGFLQDLVNYVQKVGFTYEIIIVDDGSNDATVSITDTILNKHISGRYRIISLPHNQGKGCAVQRGMLAAEGEYVFFLDADGSTSITETDSFIRQFSPDVPVYISVRTIKHHAPFKRKFFGYGYIYLANLLLGANVSDFTCGFKCYRRDAAREIFSRQTLANWSFDAENLFVARKHGYSITEIPVYWKHFGGSKVRVLKNIITCGFDLFIIRLNDILGRYGHGRT